MVVNRSTTPFIPRKNYFAIPPSYIRGQLLQQGIDSKLVLPLTEVLSKLFNKFAVDERLNYDMIEQYLRTPAPSMPRSATVVIESSDTLNSGNNNADYTVPTTDDVAATLILARDDLSATGGKILLLDGTYNLESQFILNQEYTYLEGMGPGTIIVTSGSAEIECDQDHLKISNLRITGVNGISIDDMSAGVLSNIWFENMTGFGIHFDTLGTPNLNLIQGCTFEEVVAPIANDSQFGAGNSIVGNMFLAGGDDGQIFLDRCPNLLIANNYFEAAVGNAILLEGCDRVQVVGNRVTDAGGTGVKFGLGVGSTACHDILVDGNYIYSCGGNGIDAGGSDTQAESVISNNHMKDNAGVGIIISGDRNFCHGNRVEGTSHDYGIRIVDVDSNDNLVINNDLLNGFTTAAIDDAGTGTLFNLDGSANNWNRIA